MAYFLHNNIITSLGFSTTEVVNNIRNKTTGITNFEQFKKITEAPVSTVDHKQLKSEAENLNISERTKFEQLAICSISKAIKNSDINLSSTKTLLIFSTTKGNIELLSNNKIGDDGLVASACSNIARFFNYHSTPIVVCNACISGVLAIILAKRYIDSGIYDNVVVTGADVATDFVVSGFESFKSMSLDPCKPFDSDRTGLSLGEGAGTLILGKKPGINDKKNLRIVGGGSGNDANHISGPSRTGEGLFLAAGAALKGMSDIDFISAHGTATPYNDDMEAKAIKRLGLDNVPVNSFKGYFGHTLGAAGIIEIVLTIVSMQQNTLFTSLGFNKPGTEVPLNIITDHNKATINKSLKLSSGFGGCNAAIVIEKDA